MTESPGTFKIFGLTIRHTLISFTFLLLFPFVSTPGQSSEDPYLLFQMSEQACQASNLSRSLHFLKQAFEAGYPTPSKVLTNGNFRLLRESSEYRRLLRTLMKNHIRETEITLVDAREEGERMIIYGTLINPDSTPVADVTLYFYHTDDKGLYAPEHLRGGFGSNNPRLFGYVKTNQYGDFKVTTIRPNSYPGYRNLRHVHFEILTPGCSQVSQFNLDRDPEPTPTQVKDAQERNFPVLHATTNAKGHFEVRFVRMCP